MEAECTKWGRLVLSQLVSQAQKVRERAFSCLKEQTAFFSSHAEFAHLASSDLKMVKLFVYINPVWVECVSCVLLSKLERLECLYIYMSTFQTTNFVSDALMMKIKLK